MTVNLHERTSVDFELEIEVPREELEPRLNEALKAQRKTMNLKGFRPGKVPLQMVRKMHGDAVAAQVAEQIISEAWREEVEGRGESEILGSPRITKLEFAFDSDLKAVLRFGVRPQFDLADTSDVTVRRLVRPVSEEDLEDELQRRLRRAATLEETQESADEQSVLTVDIQEVDKESDTPIIGRRDEDQDIDLTDERLRAELRDALVGKKTGDSFKIDLPHNHPEGEGHDHDDHIDRYMVTVKKVQARRLPDLDDEFAKEQTAGNVESVDDFRAMVQRELEEASRRLGEDFLREEIIREALEAHQFEVPESLVESMLDDMEEDLAKRAGGELPEEFDRETFRASQRDNAEHQSRWMLIQDKLSDGVGLKVTDEEFDAEFERLAESGPGSVEMVKQFVSAQPQLLQGIRQRILTQKMFDLLAERFTVVEVSPDELEGVQES